MNGMRYQPQGPARVNRAGLGRGVQMLLMPRGGTLVDVVNNKAWTSSGNVAIKGSPQGQAVSLAGTDNAYYFATGYENLVGNVGTFFIWMPRVGPRDINGQIFFGTNVGSAVFFQLGISDDAYVFGGGVNGSAANSVFSSRNRALAFASGGTAASKRFFVNGTGSGTPDGSTPTAFAAGSKTFRFGGWMGGNLWDADCDAVIAGFTTEVWTEAQARQFYENPWQLIADPDEDEVYVALADSATSGSFASTLANVACSAAGTVVNAGSLTASLGNTIMSSLGLVGDIPSGSFSTALNNATMTASGQLLYIGSIGSTLSGAGFAASGNVAQQNTGAFAAVMQGVSMAAYGYEGAAPVATESKRYRWRILRRHQSQ